MNFKTFIILFFFIIFSETANGSSLNVYGDSFSDTSTVNGIGYGGKYPKILANLTNYTTLINLANSGMAITDTFTLEGVYKFDVNGQNDSLMLWGYNDMRLKANTSLNLTAYNETLESILVFKTLSNSSKVFADNPKVKFNSTWTPQTVYGRQVYFTNSRGANVSFNFTGSTLIIGYVKAFNSGVTDAQKGWNVSIDGVIVGNYTANTAYVSPQGTATHPAVVTISGLSNSFHQAIIYYNGSATASANIRFDYFANDTTSAYNVFAGNTVRMLNYLASPTAPYGSDASNAEYNQINYYVASKLRSLGYSKIYYVDVNSSYNPNIHIGVDEIHPNAAGFTAISNSFYAVMLTSIPTTQTTAENPTVILIRTLSLALISAGIFYILLEKTKILTPVQTIIASAIVMILFSIALSFWGYNG